MAAVTLETHKAEGDSLEIVDAKSPITLKGSFLPKSQLEAHSKAAIQAGIDALKKKLGESSAAPGAAEQSVSIKKVTIDNDSNEVVFDVNWSHALYRGVDEEGQKASLECDVGDNIEVRFPNYCQWTY